MHQRIEMCGTSEYCRQIALYILQHLTLLNKCNFLARYDEELFLWKATDKAHKEFLAISNAKKTSLLLGPQEWTFYNDSKSCSLKSTYTTVLKLTGCSDEEFTCDSGSCVPLSARCNGRSECLDETDEAECKAFVQSLGYNRFMAPPPSENETRHLVYHSFEIHDIIDINEKDGLFICKILLKRRWFDKRVTFQNLKNDTELNIIVPEDQELLWKPWTVFSNIKDRYSITLADQEPEWRVIPKPNDTFLLADKSFLHNTYLFDGASNMISYEKALTVEWICDFHMEWYPFDTQICKMEFLSKDNSVRPIHEKVTISDIDLQRHFIRNIALCPTTIDGKEGITVSLSFGRPIFSSFLTVS